MNNQRGQSQLSHVLELVAEIELSAISEFSAEVFQVGVREGVTIGYVNGLEKGISRLVEQNVPALKASVYRLIRNPHTDKIMDQFDGEGRLEMKLAHTWELLKPQGRGQEGVLVTDERPNIFFVRDVQGSLRTVCCFFRPDGRGWRVNSYVATDYVRWREGGLLFVPA